MFIEGDCTPEQLEALAVETHICELTRRIGAREFFEPANCPPSPPPQYDRFGRRTNTREQRLEHALEAERTLAVYRAFEVVPNYVPPPRMRVARHIAKVYVPASEHPSINFVGLLLGPRGQELRRLELASGARISIRGRGSIKEGNNEETEPLHCIVSSASPDGVNRARREIKRIVDIAVTTPEHENSLKREQLRRLAQLNGTLRDNDASRHAAEFMRDIESLDDADAPAHALADTQTRPSIPPGISPPGLSDLAPPGLSDLANIAPSIAPPGLLVASTTGAPEPHFGELPPPPGIDLD